MMGFPGKKHEQQHRTGGSDEHRPAEARSDGRGVSAAGTAVPTNSFLPGPSGNFYPISSSSPSPYFGLTPQEFLAQQVKAIKFAAQMAERAVLKSEAWDGVTVYRGWRAFLLYPDTQRGVFRLRSVVQATMWETGELTATCSKGTHEGNIASGCACGIYIFNDRTQALKQVLAEYPDAVIGECVAGGTVIECELGYRVEQARIEGLWTLTGSPELCAMLSEHYGVPCRNLWDAISGL